MKKILSGLFAASVLLVACGGGSLCPKKACPNDPEQSDADVKKCEDSIKDDAKCGKELRTIADCAARNRTCGSDGKTDPASVNGACGLYSFGLLACLSKNTDAGM